MVILGGMVRNWELKMKYNCIMYIQVIISVLSTTTTTTTTTTTKRYKTNVVVKRK